MIITTNIPCFVTVISGIISSAKQEKSQGCLEQATPLSYVRPVAFCPHLTVGLALSDHGADMTHDFAREACHL
jgi:hypothetical protein